MLKVYGIRPQDVRGYTMRELRSLAEALDEMAEEVT